MTREDTLEDKSHLETTRQRYQAYQYEIPSSDEEEEEGEVGCVLCAWVIGMLSLYTSICTTVEPPNNGHVRDEHFVHCSEVVPLSEVEMYGQYIGRGQGGCPLFRASIIRGSTLQSVHYQRFHSSERPLSEVPLYTSVHTCS